MAPSVSSVVSFVTSGVGASSRRRAICKPSLAETALSWGPFRDLAAEMCYSYQDVRGFWPCVHRYAASSNLPHGLHHPTELVLVLNACPQCRRQPKLPDHRFCSVTCGQSAASTAPELKYLPAHHEMYMKVATQFMKSWKQSVGPPPKVWAVFMITWTASSEQRFRQYRDEVEARGHFQIAGYSPGNEQKRFRCTFRACTLGERGNIIPCHHEACRTCETIRVGFEPQLVRKRQIGLHEGGIRLGAGIYTSHTSSKADQYAIGANDAKSKIKAMLVCRAVIGRPYETTREDHTIRRPPSGYDCVVAKPGHDFQDDEYVFYDADAIRPAYLVLYERGAGGI